MLEAKASPSLINLDIDVADGGERLSDVFLYLIDLAAHEARDAVGIFGSEAFE